MALDTLLADWHRGDAVSFLALLAVGSVAVGYEVGSALAGDPFRPLWLVPILGMIVAVGTILGAEAGPE